MEIIHWLWREKCPFNRESYVSVVESNNFELVKQFYKKTKVFNSNITVNYHRILVVAIEKGNLDIVKWITSHEIGNIEFSTLISISVNFRRIEIFKYLFQKFEGKLSLNEISYLFNGAVSNEDKEIMEFLFEKYSTDCFSNKTASSVGLNFPLIRWLVERTCPMDANILQRAINNKSFSIVKYLLNHRCYFHFYQIEEMETKYPDNPIVQSLSVKNSTSCLDAKEILNKSRDKFF